jgi:hypothetical protein
MEEIQDMLQRLIDTLAVIKDLLEENTKNIETNKQEISRIRKKIQE